MFGALDGLVERCCEAKSEYSYGKMSVLWGELDVHSAGRSAHGVLSWGKMRDSRSGRPLGTLLGHFSRKSEYLAYMKPKSYIFPRVL